MNSYTGNAPLLPNRAFHKWRHYFRDKWGKIIQVFHLCCHFWNRGHSRFLGKEVNSYTGTKIVTKTAFHKWRHYFYGKERSSYISNSPLFSKKCEVWGERSGWNSRIVFPKISNYNNFNNLQMFSRNKFASDGSPRIRPLLGVVPQRRKRGPDGPLLQRFRNKAEAQWGRHQSYPGSAIRHK